MTKIGITLSESNYPNYPLWIKGNDASIAIIELSYESQNLQEVAQCDAIVFSGGIDMDPGEQIEYPNAPKEFNLIRDQFEMAVLKKALEERKPILGICRGLQLINVFLEGTLHLDNGEAKNKIHKKESEDKTHPIKVEKDSIFYSMVQQEFGIVNSAHHQSIDRLGSGLKAVAETEDGVIEAIESSNPEKQFLIAVQWHPERMSDSESPFCKNILKAFLEKTKQSG
ncbi:gamma-glutamyl-gamma-aminobutyrate hydrolase family protein [Flavobacterium nackdongense]|uniref:Gamma-glutamyl-gamma-aminobutyrate hydrolase family protein n=1 Tax=Flavobacterium nackdongense TaxID=2547394 RepID=A0A4P6Y8Y4_9FLAO|nr:gamma-glutamyl-gamma-aminobutyrate hydrolase family protein [Flavobacterium nackdongense]QBN18368.1 gamma-glutamyl-gamma-aminobutyrate hydrolase family protein [Flavobacterium nackdongense]